MKVARRKKATAKKRPGLKQRAREARPISLRPIVLRGDEPKSGCRWCPLFPWSADFPCEGDYHLDADKQRAKEPEGHRVRNRCVQEPEWTQVDVLCVGEAPGGDEDRVGLPFVGRSGKLLRETIQTLAETTPLKVEQFGFTNVVRCRPSSRNRKPGKTEIKSCLPQLVREIEARKPKVLMAFGGIALEYLTGQTGITSFNARVLDCVLPGWEDLKVVACVHPAYILRMDHELPKFIEAFEVLADVVMGTHEPLPGPGEYAVLTRLAEVRGLIASYRKVGTKVAVDTETGSLYWFQEKWPRLLCFSLTNKAGEAYVIPLDHKDSPWRVGGPLEHERAELFTIIGGLLEDPGIEKVLQNGKFDAKHVEHAIGYALVNYRDTMLTHLVLDERKGTHGLKTLAYGYTGMGGYEKPLDDYCEKHPEANVRRGGSYANVPGEILFVYAGMDADVTFRVDEGLLAEEAYRTNPRLQALAETFLPALSVVLSDIEYEGAQIDKRVVKKLDKKYTRIMADKTREIARFPAVVEYAQSPDKTGDPGVFNPGSHRQLQDVLFGYMGATPVSLTDGGLKRLSLRYDKAVQKWRNRRKGPKPRFQSVVQKAIRSAEWEFFSTDAEVLHELERKGNKLCPLILEYRAAETLYGTFVKPLMYNLDPHGRIHGNFNIHGTVTGRLSSDDPNLQNIPNKGGGLIKSAYVSRFGDEGLLGQADYSQIELRVAASVFSEPNMLRAYREGQDVHMLTAIDISGLSPEKFKRLSSSDQKAWRTRAKRINFGILYGGGPPTLQNTLRKDGVFVTLDECRELLERYFRVRPKLKEGIAALERGVRKLGYLESFTGRRRRLPEVYSEDEEIVARALRQSGNFPIQNGASEMTLMSLVLIWQEMQDRGYRSKIILTVHDSIIFDLHVDEAFEVMSLARQIMESITKLSDQVLPGLDWSWLKVPIVADCEVGRDWQALVGIDPDDILRGATSKKELWAWDEEKEDWFLARDPANEDELWEVIEWKREKKA